MERLTESNPSWIDDELWERACEEDEKSADDLEGQMQIEDFPEAMPLSGINAKTQMEIQFMFWTNGILISSRPPTM